MKKILKDSFKGIILIILILALMQIAYADTILSVDLTVYKNDTVTVDRLKIEYGKPTIYQPPGDYSIVIIGEKGETLINKSITLRFQRQMNPPIPLNYSYLIERIRYTKDMDEIRLYHRNKLIFNASIDTCDSDNACDTYESCASCPQDCPLNKSDDVCNPNINGVCDPDCSPQIDPDCGNHTSLTSACGNAICEPGLGEDTLTCKQDCPTQTNNDIDNLLIALELTIILTLILTAIWYYNKTRNK